MVSLETFYVYGSTDNESGRSGRDPLEPDGQEVVIQYFEQVRETERGQVTRKVEKNFIRDEDRGRTGDVSEDEE